MLEARQKRPLITKERGADFRGTSEIKELLCPCTSRYSVHTYLCQYLTYLVYNVRCQVISELHSLFQVPVLS